MSLVAGRSCCPAGAPGFWQNGLGRLREGCQQGAAHAQSRPVCLDSWLCHRCRALARPDPAAHCVQTQESRVTRCDTFDAYWYIVGRWRPPLLSADGRGHESAPARARAAGPRARVLRGVVSGRRCARAGVPRAQRGHVRGAADARGLHRARRLPGGGRAGVLRPRARQVRPAEVRPSNCMSPGPCWRPRTQRLPPAGARRPSYACQSQSMPRQTARRLCSLERALSSAQRLLC